MLGKKGKEIEFKKAVAFSKDQKNGNIKRAIELFKVALENPEYRALSVDYLVQLYIKIGDFSQARKILTKYAEERNMLSWAKLENIELNYQTSKKYYQKINDNDLEQRKKLALARIEFQLGNYKQGRELLNALKYDKK